MFSGGNAKSRALRAARTWCIRDYAGRALITCAAGCIGRLITPASVIYSLLKNKMLDLFRNVVRHHIVMLCR
jgi:hypothetical protein